MAIKDNLGGNSIKQLSFPVLAEAGIGAGKDGQITNGQSVVDIGEFGFTKIKFDIHGHGWYGSRASAVLYGSTDGGATFSKIIWSISDNNVTNQELDISEYNCLKFTTSYTAGGYSSAASFRNIIIS